MTINNSLYFKNFIVTASLVLVSFLLLGTAVLFLGRRVLGSDRQTTMTEIAEEIADAAAVFGSASDAPDADFRGWQGMEMRVLLSSVARSSGFRIFLTDVRGTVVSCSDAPGACTHVGRTVPADVLRGAQDGRHGFGYVTRMEDFSDATLSVVAAPISGGAPDTAAGLVLVTAETANFSGAWSSFVQMFFFTSVIVLLIAVAISFAASKRLAKPLNEMAAASRRFAHGDFSARVEIPDRDDELGALTESFNAMAESLEKSEERRQEFIANVSHELKTPMTTIAGFADGILDGTIPRENQDRYLQTISAETKRLSRLVRRMLELAKIREADKMTLLSHEFDAREMLTRTLLSFEDKITKHALDADVRIPEEDVIVRGDVDAIEQVVYNLLENAVKFSPEGSTLGVALWKQGDKACISVKNSGETIPPEELGLLFERFHKTDRSRSRDRDGVGLGLYIVKSILNNHDEDIYVTSRNGVTEFVFTLALRERARAQK